MKIVLFSLFILSAATAVKAQCITIYANEKIKGLEIPIEQTEFEVYINDSLKKKGSTKSDGFLGRIYLGRGTYRVKIVNPAFSEGFKEEVVVNDEKTTSIQIVMLRSTDQAEGRKKSK